MKVLAVIPARAGSKRLPGKNVRLLGDRPLIAWSIACALKSGVCDSVLVSTDDPAIVGIALAAGARSHGLRPAELASDTAGSADVALHELAMAEAGGDRFDGIMLLQPTSPFREPDSIGRAAELFASAGGRRPVASFRRALDRPEWCFRAFGDRIDPCMGWDLLQRRSQDLPDAWALDGSIYLISPEALRRKKAFVTQDTIPLIADDPAESIDIDTEEDWLEAEIALSRGAGRWIAEGSARAAKPAEVE